MVGAQTWTKPLTTTTCSTRHSIYIYIYVYTTSSYTVISPLLVTVGGFCSKYVGSRFAVPHRRHRSIRRPVPGKNQGKSWDWTDRTGGWTIEHGDLTIQNGDLTIHNGDFEWFPWLNHHYSSKWMGIYYGNQPFKVVIKPAKHGDLMWSKKVKLKFKRQQQGLKQQTSVCHLQQLRRNLAHME